MNYHYPELGLRPRLVVAADVLAQQRDFARAALGYALATDDWRDVVAHPDVQAISITAPNYLHREIASAVAAAGKHFWIEKPVGRTTDDCSGIGRKEHRERRAVDVQDAVGAPADGLDDVGPGTLCARDGHVYGEAAGAVGDDCGRLVVAELYGDHGAWRKAAA